MQRHGMKRFPVINGHCARVRMGSWRRSALRPPNGVRVLSCGLVGFWSPPPPLPVRLVSPSEFLGLVTYACILLHLIICLHLCLDTLEDARFSQVLHVGGAHTAKLHFAAATARLTCEICLSLASGMKRFPLGQKSCRTKVSRIFRFFDFSSRVLHRILLRIFPEFLEEFSCFILRETETRKNSPKIPAIIQCKIPRQLRRKNPQFFFWRAVKVAWWTFRIFFIFFLFGGGGKGGGVRGGGRGVGFNKK